MSGFSHDGDAGRRRAGLAGVVLFLVILGAWHGSGDGISSAPLFAFERIQFRSTVAGMDAGQTIRIHTLSDDSFNPGEDPAFDAVSEFYVGERKAWEGGNPARFYRPGRAGDDNETGRLKSSLGTNDEETDAFTELFGDDRTKVDTERGWLAERVYSDERRDRRAFERETFVRDATEYGNAGTTRQWGLERIDSPAVSFGQRMRPLSDSGYGLRSSTPPSVAPPGPVTRPYELRQAPRSR